VPLSSSVNVYLDKASDTLYVGGNSTYSGSIAVISKASTLNGVVTPDRVLNFPSGVNHFAIDTTRDVLYVVNSLQGVHVFRNFSASTGGFGDVHIGEGGSGLALDQARNRLYVANVFNGVQVIDNASTAAGGAAAGYLNFATGGGFSNTQFVSYDPSYDRLYIGAYTKAYVLNSASSLRAGSLLVAATTGPAGSSLAGFAFP